MSTARLAYPVPPNAFRGRQDVVDYPQYSRVQLTAAGTVSEVQFWDTVGSKYISSITTPHRLAGNNEMRIDALALVIDPLLTDGSDFLGSTAAGRVFAARVLRGFVEHKVDDDRAFETLAMDTPGAMGLQAQAVSFAAGTDFGIVTNGDVRRTAFRQLLRPWYIRANRTFSATLNFETALTVPAGGVTLYLWYFGPYGKDIAPSS